VYNLPSSINKKELMALLQQHMNDCLKNSQQNNPPITIHDGFGVTASLRYPNTLTHEEKESIRHELKNVRKVLCCSQHSRTH
jgi:hypothetical protein